MDEDILAYWVYIPRYAYEVQRRDAVDQPSCYGDKTVNSGSTLECTHDTQVEYNIKFENAGTLKKSPRPSNSTDTVHNNYLDAMSSYRTYPTTATPGQETVSGVGLNTDTTWSTHPAFTFGDEEEKKRLLTKQRVCYANTPAEAKADPSVCHDYYPVPVGTTFSEGIDYSQCIATEANCAALNITQANAIAGADALDKGKRVAKVTELNGLWAGKFEVGTDFYCHNTTATTPVSCGANTAPNSVYIKPNKAPMVNKYIGAQFTIAKNMSPNAKLVAGGNTVTNNTATNTMNFSSSTLTRQIKNSDWGAATILSTTTAGVYGSNNVFTAGQFTTEEKKVYNNGYDKSATATNNSNVVANYGNITGCGPESSKSDGNGTSCNDYASPIGQEASTTGNVYGIYDMAGGIWENTMSNRGNVADSNHMATMPQTRYIDSYYVSPFGNKPSWSSSSTEYEYNFDNCLFETCGGQSLHEARIRQSVSDGAHQSWGSDGPAFADPDWPWFIRGGASFGDSYAGLWASVGNDSSSWNIVGFRVVAQSISKAISIPAQKKNYQSIQSFSNHICNNNLPPAWSYSEADDYAASTVILVDDRDGQEYRVRRTKDHYSNVYCWMIDNLKFELTDGMLLTPQDTNVNVDTTVSLATGGLTDNFTTSGYLTADNTDSTGTDYDNYNAWRQADPSNTTNCKTNTGDSINGGLAYNTDSKTGCGYLYNHYTARAGGKGSICPAGWFLPWAEAFATLDNRYSGSGSTHSGLASQALWLSAGVWQGTFSGSYDFGFSQQGSSGLYWSNAAWPPVDGNGSALYFDSNDYVYPGAYDNVARPNGLAVRCYTVYNPGN